MIDSGSRKLISIRIDRGVLDWFRRERPTGYQSLMHTVLQGHMERETTKRSRAAGRGQELFRQFYSQCFWHYDRELQITPDNLELVVDGLKKHGGREGLRLAEELCR